MDFLLDCCMCTPQEKEGLKVSSEKNMEYTLLTCEICRNHCSHLLFVVLQNLEEKYVQDPQGSKHPAHQKLEGNNHPGSRCFRNSNQFMEG